MRTASSSALTEHLHHLVTEEIRDFLQREGITQTELARRLGISKGRVSKLINAPTDTKLSTIAHLADAMGKEPMLVFVDQRREAYRYPDGGGRVDEPEKSYGDRLRQKVNWADLRDLPVLEQATAMKADIDSRRPFSRNMEEHVLQQTLNIWNYNSNAIEGNTLTYGETLTLLLYGITAKGKPLKDHLDIIGHRDAVNVMLDMVKGERPLRQTDVRQFHQIMLKENYPQRAITPDGWEVYRTIHVGIYKREPNHVRTSTGKMHYFAEPNAVAGLLRDLFDWYEEVEREDTLHPLLRAAILHHEFLAIHPFDDGNGRIGRIVMNFALLRAGYPVAIIPVTNRLMYYRALASADEGDYLTLVEFIGARLLEALDVQLATARGEDIGGSKWDTPDDDPR
ncbi:helix-turn-helix protein [Neolewinella xylanilytica]|uniref:Helix-turn-helix protein n=1 Tax=Neolewinella xylanilytica TaxID=1514080 RepID=A0A2S6I368_9BACT|nr:Fic family protein [Neolewinella xylanilytica]PPK85603.1 helix-turn-helix protein [Neolewinella xylanilytica]